MKESVKITVIAAGFREVANKKTHTRPSYLPKTWKTGREQPSVVAQVARNVTDVIQEVAQDDLDVPTFLRRQAAKA